MAAASNDLPDDIDALKAALLAANDRAEQVTAELAVAKAKASDDQALITHQQLQIAKLTRELYGQHSERSVRLLDQMELTFEELESSATEDELAAERAAAKTTNVVAFIRKRPARQPFPEHLPRERVVEPGPSTCQCCGSARLRKLGEDVTETLEVIPRRWKVIQHVREKFTCRDCEKISHPVREVRAASAAQPPGRTLRRGGGAAEPVDPGRPGGCLLRRAGTCATTITVAP